MKNIVRFLAVLAGLNTLYFGWMLVKRLRMTYDAAGRYFDASTGTIIHKQTALPIGIIFMAGLLLTLTMLLMSRKLK